MNLEVRLQHAPDQSEVVGRLALHARRCYFEYEARFVDGGRQLSPFKLALQHGLIEHRDMAFGPLFGLFDDSMPDGWGRLLMDRHFRQQGKDLAMVAPLDRLAWLGTRTMGALTYHPCTPSSTPEALNLPHIAREAAKVVSGSSAEILPALLRAGGSPAGARPKVLIGLCGDLVLSGEDDLPDGFEHWMVKFPAAADGRAAGAVEYAYALMATAAGIQLPAVRLFDLPSGPRCFAVQRFDRAPGNRRTHMHSLANLLHADFRIPSLDYSDLLRLTLALTRNRQDVARAYRLMLFNIAAHNRDDHGKNFAFVLPTGQDWTLSPAFDLCPSDGPGGEHSTSVHGEGRNPTREQCLKLAKLADIRVADALAMLDEVNGALQRWPIFADLAGLARRTRSDVGQRLRVL